MKKLLTLISSTLLVGGIFAQSPQEQTRPYMTSVEQNSKGAQALCDTTVHFFEPPSSSSVGYGGAVNWRAAIYVDSVEFKFYVGTPTIEAIQFQVADLSVVNSVWVRIYENASISNYTTSATLTQGTEIYAADITSSAVNGSFGIYTLDSSIEVNPATGYLVAIELDQNTAGFPMSVDNGPAQPAKGGWISPNGAPFSPVSSDANWAIRICTGGDIIDPDFDVNVDDAFFTPTGYEITPLDQLDPAGYNFWVDVQNTGNSAVDAVTKINVNSGVFVDSANISAIAVNNIGRGTMTNPYVIPDIAGTYNVEASVRIDSNDFNLADNRKNGSFIITDIDSLYYSRTVNSDFYTGNARFNGNVYEVYTTQTWVKSVTARYFNPSAQILNNGTELVAQIWDMNPDGSVGSLQYVSDTLVLDSITGARRYVFEFPFSKSNVVLFEGKHLIAVSNPGCLLTNTVVNFYEPNTAFGNSNPNNPNWSETTGQYYNIDVLLSDTRVNSIDAKFNDNSISIYPNPAKDMIRIDGTDANGSIQILDVTGKVVANTNSSSSSTVIELSNFNKGVYILRYINNNSILTEKLIVE